jgi:hypothetical protein
MGSAHTSGSERVSNMATKTQKPVQQSRPAQSRQIITFELVARLAPSDVQAEKMSGAFGLNPVDYHAIRESTEEQIGLAAKALQPTVNDTAMRIHLQRVVGAFVGSAHGAATFYGAKTTQARDLTSKLANNDRDEDRDGVHGSESKAARARRFAAEAGLTAYALKAAAEGAVHAYAEITGEDWQPYEPPPTAAGTVSRQSATTEMEALG